jgi:hypothetical protein
LLGARVMTRSVLVLGSVSLFACGGKSPYTMTNGGADNPAPKGVPQKIDFEAAPAGGLPADFAHVLGDWTVEQSNGTKILKQTGEFETDDFPRIILKDLAFTNVHVKVRCAMHDGDTDRACGIMFRVRDSDNYYITRANTLEDNVRLYRVVGGDRQQFANADLPVQAHDWHTLEAFAEGTKLRVLYDGREIISAEDATFASGKVGLWTKADSITSFDELEATEL